MSSTTIRLDANFGRWENWLKSLDKTEVAKMKERILRTSGLRELEYLHDLTPRRSGRLQNSMTMGAQGNTFSVKVSNKVSKALVGTNVPYAEWANNGFTQKAGQFVPGEWRSGTFHYQPGFDGGMVLTGKTIEGAHMFEKSLEYLEDDVPRIIEYELRRLFQRLGG